MGEAITGDPRVYGRVYLGTNGRGILYADRTGGPDPTTTTTTSTTRTSTGTTSTSTSTSTGPPPPAGCRVDYRTDQWSGGFTARLTVTNTGGAAIDGWTLAFSFPSGQRVADGWSATWFQPSGSPEVTATNLSWNAVIAPGSSVELGFNGTWSGSNPAPAAFTLNGSRCSG